ncbi:predicted protein [Cyanophage PSS2]|uniref:hypothetical protein n=1 Tax=Cyanophage PSS2 TaxID=658401 RepID=UPI0001B03FED|nr:hypothetical protein PSS2_gp024 [Cyanophage PSS2]ACT65586.1 hypothetical protein [Cyanophage PSS2]ACY75728.1 predicted protein [Cyanophage PSS2]
MHKMTSADHAAELARALKELIQARDHSLSYLRTRAIATLNHYEATKQEQE